MADQDTERNSAIEHVNVVGVILAAGESRRLGRPKQLLEFHGRPLLAHVIDSALASRLSGVIVVLGANEGRILEAVELSSVEVVRNPRFAEGMSSSIIAALGQIDSAADGVLFLLGDQPGVTSDVIDAVVDAFDGEPNSIVMPTWQGTPANPVLFGRSYLDELSSLKGDDGARPVVKRHRDLVHLVPIDRPVPPDVDTEDDYRRLLRTGC